ncbi:MAG: DUF305 domain-containing protein [Trueperaceae bacterium]|nr:MAG: DUF305 domain-containing protein [Trueperaceae bacterium]
MNTANVARTLALGLVVALLATAIAQGMQHGPGHGHDARSQPESAQGTGTSMGGGMDMGSGMAMGMATHTVDEASFLVHMIPHHEEAVTSAQALLAVTERPELRALADDIIRTQTEEIAAMEAWLDAWHPDATRDVEYVPMMRDLGPDAAAEAVERAFLEDMIAHHMMAVHEAQTLLMGGLAEHAEVEALARSIVAEQMAEMHQMRAWLADWFGVTAPMGQMMGEGMPGARMGGAMHGGMMHGGTMHGTAGMGMHGGHGHHDGRVALVGAAEATRLAQAFLDGRGDGIVTGVEEPVVTFEVRFDDAAGGGVLIVDARTGTVRLASER